MAISQHIPTHQPHADALCHLVAFPRSGTVTIGDLTGCGAGNLLAPFAHMRDAQLFGVEISAARAEAAQARLPTATIVRAPFEVTRPTAESFSLCVSNPPYVRLDDGRRAEYAAQVLITRALVGGGVSLAIIPARSGLDGALINHYARHYQHLRCWRFPDGDADQVTSFQTYTQIVVAAVKRPDPLDAPDPQIKAQLQGWRFDSQTDTWAGGEAPPVLPTEPIADPYLLPPAAIRPELLVLHADDDVLLHGLASSGVHTTAAWQQAVTLQAAGIIARPLMPPTGPAHLAALILSGLLDGDILDGPHGERFVITTATAKQATRMPIDDDQCAKGVVAISQIEDNPVLGVLDLDTGSVTHYQNDAAFAFLQPLLPTLTAQVLATHQPRYQLDPQDWEIGVVAQIGLDKQLPGVDHPGLAPAQMHRVFALRRALWDTGRALFQGEPGVGKTRALIALIATLCQYWQAQATAFRGTVKPAWARRLAKAWKANRHTPGAAPKALPIWIAPPKRVMPTWRREIAGAFPAAEVLVIRDHRDVDRWLARCATSDAPAVIALIAHSTKAATGLRWQPAVLPRTTAARVPDLHPPAELRPFLEDVTEGRHGRVVAYRDRRSDTIVMTTTEQSTFACPDCHSTVTAVPRGKVVSDDDTDAAEPVTSLTYFEKKQRRCAQCGSPLWSMVKTEARERAYPHTPFATWAQAAEQRPDPDPQQRITPDGGGGPHCPDSFSPYQYADRKYRGCIALAIIDESHNGRSATTDIAQAHHQMQLASQCRVLASGTHTGGELRHLFHYTFRYHPQFWLRLGLGWTDVDTAVRRFGVVQEHITERESDARKGSGAVDRTVATIEVPGMSATLLPHFLSEMVSIGVLDVGAYMPKLVEIPLLVAMDDPALRAHVAQAEDARTAAAAALEAARDSDDAARIAAAAQQLASAEEEATQAEAWADARDLARHYQHITSHLDELAKQRNNAARLAKGSVPRWWSVLPMVAPPFTVHQQLRGPWGDILGETCILTAPLLAADHVYPLERTVQELVARERQQQRRVLCYVEQNGVRVTAARYASVLAAYQPWCLPHLDPELREDTIRTAVHDGHAVVIAPYSHVAEGLNLQHEFETVIWIEMAQSHFLRDQASRRIWRLGKTFDPSIPAKAREVRVYYLVYQGSSGHKKLHKLGQQHGAAILFAGDTPDGALVKQAGADHTALARMSRDLHDQATETPADTADLDATFARRNDERHATLQRGRAWVGVVDTLPARLAAFRASVVVENDHMGDRVPEELVAPVPVGSTAAPHETQHDVVAPRVPLSPCRRPAPSQTPLVVQQLTLW
jgi:ribosomal protein L39E